MKRKDAVWDLTEDILRTSDIITVHVPQKEDTIGMIGKNEFEKMKKTAIIINTARGPIVEESALINALESGRILGAGIIISIKSRWARDNYRFFIWQTFRQRPMQAATPPTMILIWLNTATAILLNSTTGSLLIRRRI